MNDDTTLSSSLNVSGYTTFNNNVSCMNNLNVNGALFCDSINSTTTAILSNNLNNLSTSSILSISNLNFTSTSLLNKTNFTNLLISGESTLLSALNISGFTTLNNRATIVSTLDVSGFTILNNNTTTSSSN